MKIKKTQSVFCIKYCIFLIPRSQKTYGVANEAGEYWL